ncbi:hypothetical protein J4Q44_G00269200 [Coregonus suidteri]|uniref:Transferrin-like domain-containing protein n=1 Tax=Coregonus suidteri TaxID=861788 RepID=A0AAN8L6B5_9TELE
MLKRDDSFECIKAIKGGEADAITLDGGDIYIAGLHPHTCSPSLQRDYGEEVLPHRLWHVSSWNIPIGALVTEGQIKWAGIDDKPVESAVSDFFNASCAPGAPKGSKLWQLCKGDCSKSHKEPYYDYAGAFQGAFIIKRKEADAITVDGGQVYTAGKCGLVPVIVVGSMMQRIHPTRCGGGGKEGLWGELKQPEGQEVMPTPAWAEPQTGTYPWGLIHSKTNDCDFTKYFSKGCAPDLRRAPPFCAQCKGSGKAVGDEDKCKANADKQYYGYAGAFRCLVENAGDVAFINTLLYQRTAMVMVQLGQRALSPLTLNYSARKVYLPANHQFP